MLCSLSQDVGMHGMRNDHACAVCGAVRMGLKLPAAAVVILSRGMEKKARQHGAACLPAAAPGGAAAILRSDAACRA
ncbi:hypothetical protein D3C72_2212950 [compost metagenome]